MRTHRHEVIVHLLERFNELVDPVRAGQGNGLTGLLLMPPTYTESVRELERLLVEMRNDRHRSLLVVHGSKVSVRACWWHVNERYLRAVQRTVWRCPKCGGLTHKPAHSHRDRRGKLCSYPGVRALETQWLPAVNLRYVDAGVDWLADEWQLGSEPMLPRELMVA